MFESEMENLGLGLTLGSSDLLFPDDLLNAPLNINDVFAITTNDNDNGNGNTDDDKDLLAQVIDEIKMDSAAMADDVPFNTSSLNANTFLFEDVGSPQADAVDAKVTYSVFDDTFMGDSSNDNDGSLSDAENTSNLIHEMEQFLVQHEQPEPMSLDSTISEQEDEQSNSLLSAEDSADAKTILQALMKGDIRVDDEDHTRQKELGINNISQIITEDGQKIVIVIANDEPTNTISSQVVSSHAVMASPCYSNDAGSDWSPKASEASDSDWSPNSPAAATAHKTGSSRASRTSRAGTNTKKTVGSRGPYKRSSPYNVKDKKERKKLQNVVAARRYRDKKKSEQQTVEEVEEELVARNEELTAKAGEIAGELKTLKKLMMELGLIKVSAATARSLAE